MLLEAPLAARVLWLVECNSRIEFPICLIHRDGLLRGLCGGRYASFQITCNYSYRESNVEGTYFIRILSKSNHYS